MIDAYRYVVSQILRSDLGPKVIRGHEYIRPFGQDLTNATSYSMREYAGNLEKRELLKNQHVRRLRYIARWCARRLVAVIKRPSRSPNPHLVHSEQILSVASLISKQYNANLKTFLQYTPYYIEPTVVQGTYMSDPGVHLGSSCLVMVTETSSKEVLPLPSKSRTKTQTSLKPFPQQSVC